MMKAWIKGIAYNEKKLTDTGTKDVKSTWYYDWMWRVRVTQGLTK